MLLLLSANSIYLVRFSTSLVSVWPGLIRQPVLSSISFSLYSLLCLAALRASYQVPQHLPTPKQSPQQIVLMPLAKLRADGSVRKMPSTHTGYMISGGDLNHYRFCNKRSLSSKVSTRAHISCVSARHLTHTAI